MVSCQSPCHSLAILTVIGKPSNRDFELHMIANGHDELPTNRRVAMLLSVAGQEAIDIYNTFEFP